MSPKYHMDIIQNTDQWYEIKTGVLSASQIKNLISPKLKIANNEKTRASGYEIVAQRASGIVEEGFMSWAMQRGHVEEEYAKQVYSKHHVQTKDCGFVTNDEWGFTIGFSPDALVGEDGLVEVKSRCQKYQIKTVIENEVPEEYVLQIQTGLLVTGRKWCDFISYSNGLPMFIKRVLPNPDIHALIIDAVRGFEEKAAENLELYKLHSAKLIPTERRDFDDGQTIKPSEPAESTYMAG